MTIEEIRAAREAAEREILAIMDLFRIATGLAVVGCSVETIQSQRIDQATPDTLTSRVSLTVEKI
ncbi:hypothetical protein SAMN05216344_102186 [Polaromonas sp. OV174]|uniref:hypothetical protein n=1 Tax=Polaromonas sp. OV174 TaxID=1855300 RepID=UPI0008E6C596|nr:hypothetical protein [Polaromonas sp. OV174]SFB74373.1 hypothetical protein SAMN05216344_102186 [Polaromonas sp. OV174]